MMKESKLRDILVAYERKRDRSENELKSREKEVYSKLPELNDIDREIKGIGFKLTRLVLENPGDKDKIIAEAKIKMAALRNKKEQLLLRHNIPKNYLEMKYDCYVCKDTGFLKDGGKCNCLKQLLVNETYKMSNITSVLERENFNTFDSSVFSDLREEGANLSPQENMLNVLSICESFTMSFDKDNGENLLFYGPTGVGKTFMCNCIAKDLLDKGHIVVYQTAFQMFEIIEGYKFKYKKDSLTLENYDNIFKCDLLIIDDLGSELTNSFTNSELFNILNTRLLSAKKTIISTNLMPTVLGDQYGPRIFSRVFGNFRMVKFIGNDLRWEVKA